MFLGDFTGPRKRRRRRQIEARTGVDIEPKFGLAIHALRTEGDFLLASAVSSNPTDSHTSATTPRIDVLHVTETGGGGVAVIRTRSAGAVPARSGVRSVRLRPAPGRFPRAGGGAIRGGAAASAGVRAWRRPAGGRSAVERAGPAMAATSVAPACHPSRPGRTAGAPAKPTTRHRLFPARLWPGARRRRPTPRPDIRRTAPGQMDGLLRPGLPRRIRRRHAPGLPATQCQVQKAFRFCRKLLDRPRPEASGFAAGQRGSRRAVPPGGKTRHPARPLPRSGNARPAAADFRVLLCGAG